ncbi:hypothetical protein [Nostoc sp. NMS4]|uniref:DUF7219 family protein n=1 Tax=Nostoc sp. NMS4 TaxID=2815390 RepID=UPI0025E19C6D|nr:hypothetical protein [Nostoc sp. NMS4]MBN3925702.1 hypothetical protein [Nostoc sp. NMS4]
MTQPNSQDKNNFLYPRSRYYGKFQPENLVFNANLQEFSQKISYITSLETGGKLSQEEAYEQIKALWKQLKHSKKQLALGRNEEV